MRSENHTPPSFYHSQNFNKKSCGEVIHDRNPRKVLKKSKPYAHQRSYLNITPTNRQEHLFVAASS